MLPRTLLRSCTLGSVSSPRATAAFFSTGKGKESIQNDQVQFPRPHQWNRAVSEAERLVGFPTSLLSMRTIMENDVTSMATHVRKLMGSDHPILKTLKRLIYHDKNNLQVRGLMVLLLCRALGQQWENESDYDEDSKIMLRQRKLAEYIEMIYSAQAIHKSVLNLPSNFHDDEDSDLKEDLLQLEYGNKIAILGGDYLLAHACTGLADLRNTHVVEIISIAIADFTQSEFLGKRDIQGRMIPTADHITLDSWLHRNTLAYGNLMSNGCKSCVLLGGASESLQQQLGRIGMNLSLALQCFSELQPYSEDSSVSAREALDLSSAPVLFHLQNDAELLKYIGSCEDNVAKLEAKKIFETVKSGPGLEMTQELCSTHTDRALDELSALPDGDAKDALKKLTAFLKSPPSSA